MLKDIIDALVEENRQAHIKQRNRVIARAEELNAGFSASKYGRDSLDKCVSPTWGVDDRPHAPFDGYLWENELGEIEAYHGGSYLPYVSELDNFDKPEYTGDHGWWKLRLTTNMYVELKLFGYPIEVREPYKQWELEDATTVLMVEVRAHKKILKAISDFSASWFEEYYENAKKLKGEAPEGKCSVKGDIISVKVYEDFYGVQCKMTVRFENGSTAYGTLPKSIEVDYRGPVEFSATFTRATNDNTHSFFKRPRIL